MASAQQPSPSGEGYNPDYFEPLYQVEEHHFWFRARKRAIAAALSSRALPAGARILEVGCGTGNVLSLLAEMNPHAMVAGLDLFGEGLRFARKRSAARLVQADMQHPPFDAPFDMVGLFDVLEHLPDDESILRSLRTLLAPQGVLLLTVPAHMALWSHFDEAARHIRRYAPQDLLQRLETCGFEVEYLTPYMGAIYPFVWLRKRLAALWPRKGQPDPDAMAAQELRVVPILNTLMLGLLGLETRRIVQRRTLRWGTSLLAIARRR